MIEFQHIDKYYESTRTTVFKDFNATIEHGEFVMITGDNGSGKTTLIRMLLKEVEPDAGKIYVRERDIGRLTPEKIPYYRRNIGVIFQDFRLIPDLDAYHNIKLAPIAVGGSWKNTPVRIGNIMKMMGISHLRGKKPVEMSGGEQQKICLARAIVNNPQILLADEPTANLDPDSTEEILKLFRIINGQGTTIVMATHDPIFLACEDVRRIELEPSVSDVDTTELFSDEPLNMYDRVERHVEDFIEKNRQAKTTNSDERESSMQELKLEASDETMLEVQESVKNFLSNLDCPEDLMTMILIAVEEIYVNIAHYAYGGNTGEAVVQMDLERYPDKLKLVFQDHGIPYNPLEKEDPDVNLPADERPIGGLGIYMAKEIMDKMEYRYENNTNILTVEKLIN
ncbi:MAG: ATP-binding cassette domain-containing protein [Lachnospiraceae bacterium]|nr:ATP-binding cassette domain-containing protein [Lachnospiraceae bacterium]